MPYSDTKETSQDKQIAVNRNTIAALEIRLAAAEAAIVVLQGLH
jgi:hypothetical protein